MSGSNDPTAAEVTEHIYAVERAAGMHSVEWNDAAEYTRRNAIALTEKAMREQGSREWFAWQWMRLARAVEVERKACQDAAETCAEYEQRQPDPVRRPGLTEDRDAVVNEWLAAKYHIDEILRAVKL